MKLITALRVSVARTLNAAAAGSNTVAAKLIKDVPRAQFEPGLRQALTREARALGLAAKIAVITYRNVDRNRI